MQGRAGSGLIALLTRGRSKGISVLMSTQRPAWLSRFCFTEAQKYYIYRLTDRRDSKVLGEYIRVFSKKVLQKNIIGIIMTIAEMRMVLFTTQPCPVRKIFRR